MSSCTQVDCVPFLEDGSNKFHIIEPQLSVFYGASLVEVGKCPQETHLFIYLSSRWGRCEVYLRTRSNLDYVSAEVSTRYGILSIKVIDVMLEPGVLGNWDQLSVKKGTSMSILDRPTPALGTY
ncbi:hypothetical protein Peur_055683 [Populus x canadensis]